MNPRSALRVPLSRPSISPSEIARVRAVMERGRLATGPETAAFETAIADRCGTRHAVAVSSGTAALHLIVRALGLEPGDEVVTTPYSFVASANALLFERLAPVFVDVDPHAYNIDVDAVGAAVTTRTRAVLAVDVFGFPADWTRLTEVARQHGLALIDDACEGLGGSHAGVPLGAWGDAAAFGFYPNKQITTGEGGCVTTDSAEIADFCRSARNQGRSSDDRMHHTILGYNYRMDEMSAALGVAQLERWEELAAKREAVAASYDEQLADLSDVVRRPPRPAGAGRSWFVYVVELRPPLGRAERDGAIAALAERGIETAPYFPSIHLQPLYRERFGFRPGTFPVSEDVSGRSLALPFFPDLSLEEIGYVVDSLRAAVGALSQRRDRSGGGAMVGR